MTRAGWRWTVNPQLMIDTRAAYLRAPFDYWNSNRQPLSEDNYTEWVGGADVVWGWRKDHVLEGGWTLRRADNSYAATSYDPDGTLNSTESQSAIGWRTSEYAQESSSFFTNRLHLTGGVRVDTVEQFDIHPVSPQLSASLQIASATQLQFGVGRYNQFDFPEPALPQIGNCPIQVDFYQTANHYTAGIEQRVRQNTRVKLLLFDRQNSTSEHYSRYSPTQCSTSTFSFERDYSRGAQIVLQSRTANRLSGWIGYTVLTARQSSPTNNTGQIWLPYFPTPDDQRNTLNVFGSYRISPSVHLSGKFLFGSGFAIPSAPNPPRLGDYQRLDVRAEKDWAFDRWKLVLYGEVLNLTDHNNPRYLYTSYDPNGGAPSVVLGRGLPILPTAGLAFEF